MKEDLYDMLNDGDFGIDDYKKEEMSNLEVKRMKRRIKKETKKGGFKKYASAAAVFLVGVGVIGVGYSQNTYGDISNIFHTIGQSLGIVESLEKYSTVINQSVEDQGITVTLKEVILDQDEILYSYSTVFEEALGDSHTSMSGNVFINGRMAVSGGTGTSVRSDDYTVEEVQIDTLDGIDTKEEMNIKIAFTSVWINGEERKGNWAFEFRASGEDLMADTKAFMLDNTISLEDGSMITLQKMTVNKIGPKIYFEQNSENFLYQMELRGEDNLGNPVVFYIASVQDGSGVFKLETIDNGPLCKEAESLTLTPYAVELPKESGRMSNDYKKAGEAFTIKLK